MDVLRLRVVRRDRAGRRRDLSSRPILTWVVSGSVAGNESSRRFTSSSSEVKMEVHSRGATWGVFLFIVGDLADDVRLWVEEGGLESGGDLWILGSQGRTSVRSATPFHRRDRGVGARRLHSAKVRRVRNGP